MLAVWPAVAQPLHAQPTTSTLDKRFTVSIPPTPLLEALDRLQAATGVTFVYSPSLLPTQRLVQVDLRNETLATILDALFQPVGIEYIERDELIALRYTPPPDRMAFRQTIRGQVVDQDTQTPLPGVHVFIEETAPMRGAVTDINGQFAISGIPVGRHTIRAQHLGFKPAHYPEALLTAGKQLVVTIELEPDLISMDRMMVTASLDLAAPVNEAAVISARAFSVEHTQRFAASFADPARMVQSFAGVTRAEDDLLNEVIVRGQSPKYTVWRLEGIEIPNPNHYGEDGHSSGGINMLGSTMLAHSEFYTGAFPAEFGNALAGVFDMRLRKGNTDRREFSFSAGILGLEGAMEGPFSSRYGGSYLVNYRYSTLSLLADFNLLEDAELAYQDLSFNFHLPTRKAGTFGAFGVMGRSGRSEFVSRDTLQQPLPPSGLDVWLQDSDDWLQEDRSVAGLRHTAILSPSAYIRSAVVGFRKKEVEHEWAILPREDFRTELADEEFTIEEGFRGQTALHLKLSPSHLLQLGAGGSLISFDYRFRQREPYPLGPWYIISDAKGNTRTLRSFAQWSYRPARPWQAHLGLHWSYFELNDERILEPRMGFKWSLSERQSLAFGAGLHSQMEAFATYLIKREQEGQTIEPNRRLRKAKSWHNVLAYENRLQEDLRLRTEAYYNIGYDIPVSDSLGSPFSVINTYTLYLILTRPNGLVNKGTTRNYGLDVSLEKLFSDGSYFIVNGSLFEANYTGGNGQRYPARYGTRFSLNASGGVEWELGRRKLHKLAMNSRILFSGGNRYSNVHVTRTETDIDVIADEPYFKQLNPYFRIDFGATLTLNEPHLTHQIYADIQNITNRRNQGFLNYNELRDTFSITQQLGILPIVGYRLTF